MTVVLYLPESDGSAAFPPFSHEEENEDDAYSMFSWTAEW